MTTQTDTAPLSARLRSLDDETMCFDAVATYGLIQEAASLIDAQALVIETQDKKIDALSARFTAAEARATQAEAERDAWRNRARNHADTLRGIRKMDPLTEGDRIKTWCDDGLSGYTATVEVTTKELMDRALKAEAALSASQAREAGLREALRRARPLVALFADERRWEDHQPDGPGTEHGWYLNVSEAGCPAATDTAAEALAAIDAALSPAQPAQSSSAGLLTTETEVSNG